MPAYSYEIGKEISPAPSGTATLNGSTTVVGASTLFQTELDPGWLITINGETRKIATIIDETNLTVSFAFTASGSGFSIRAVEMKNVETLAARFSAPKGKFQNYSQPIELEDGTVRGAGWKTAEWVWGFLTQANRNLLRVYCPGASAGVWIRTRTLDNSDAYAYYAANAVWPLNEDRQASRRIDFTLPFRALVLILT